VTTAVVLLGTGTPNAEPDRQGSALAIVVDDAPYLVDFGPGVVRRAREAQQTKGIDGLALPNLKRAFLTHLHSDHTAGYPDLILTPWVLGRDEPLQVYGPTGLRSTTENILAAYQADIHERLYGLEPANPQGYQVVVHEIEAGVCYQDDRVMVEAFPVEHGSWPAFGFRFTTPDKIIVISGDTCPVESVAQQATGCDILIHEVYAVTGLASRPQAWQQYHRSVHTSSHELAAIASRARPGLLVLVHQLMWGVSEDDLLAEISEGYDGTVAYGRDLDVY